jgi:hypothetical protein
MTYAEFDRAAAGIFADACRILPRDGRVAQALLGFDAKGRQAAQVLPVAADADPADVAFAHRAGVATVTGDLSANERDVAGILAARRVVAAVTVGEAWLAPLDLADATGPEALLARPVDMPGRVEVVMVTAAWPAQGYRRMLIARIDRTGPVPVAVDPGDRPGASERTGWLERVLPGPHGTAPAALR